MASVEYYEKLFRYDDWANREVLRSVSEAAAQAGRAPGRTLSLLGHVIGAQWIWLQRLGVDGAASAVWPELALDQCQAELDRLRTAWAQYLAGLAPGELLKTVGYRNSKSELWSSTVGDILTHLTLHAAQHRAQIAFALRTAGFNPAYTDFIQAVRTGAVR
jgi:uncharacterized damage-inducible protein DinB